MALTKEAYETFNSTRCIRNRIQISQIKEVKPLSTPHGALGTDTEVLAMDYCVPFNSTRYIRNDGKLWIRWKRLETFNSTRCIRNKPTVDWAKMEKIAAFNSTRCIRNCPLGTSWWFSRSLSTPHGALGTLSDLHKAVWCKKQLSTPHGTLGTGCEQVIFDLIIVLSTPHGTLGTIGEGRLRVWTYSAFNSTRYIRNEKVKRHVEFLRQVFQLHTVH